MAAGAGRYARAGASPFERALARFEADPAASAFVEHVGDDAERTELHQPNGTAIHQRPAGIELRAAGEAVEHAGLHQIRD